MMYSNKLATAIKVNGKVLREHGETVALPFGSEYSLTFKNMNSVRALVTVEIDGRDATGGTQLIVPPGQSIDLERFIDSGNMKTGNKFKFIERTGKIEDHRGIKIEDGLIKVQFEFERMPVPAVTLTTNYLGGPPQYYDHYRPTFAPVSPFRLGDIVCGVAYGSSSNSIGSNSASPASVSKGADTFLNQASSATLSDVGITVEGSVSNQEFTPGAWFATDGVKHVMVLKLLGQIGDVPVQTPITVKTKVECPTCGTKNHSASKFCQECGTGLIVP